MTNEEIIKMMTDEDVIIFDNPSYENTLIGVTLDGQAVYDYERMIEFLKLKYEMDYEEACDFISYNYSYNPRGNYPIIMQSIIDWS